jgi:hypothetical protein
MPDLTVFKLHDWQLGEQTFVRSISPRFVELLMGLIPGWTACGHLETAAFPLWSRSHSERLRELLSRASYKTAAAAA